MKKHFALVLLVCILCPLIASCRTVNDEVDTDTDSAPLFLVNTVTPPEAQNETVPPVETQAPDPEPCSVILTAPYINRYTLDGALDIEAFASYLAEYYTGLYGEPLVICITDMVDHGDYADGRGVVTVLAEYHSYVSLESGRNDNTVCGGCNFFFSYDAASGVGFAPRPFVGDTYLHSRSEPSGNDFSEYTATVDTRGYIQLVKAGEPVIATPAMFCYDLTGFSDLCDFYIDGDSIVLVIRENNGEYVDGDWIDALAYASKDGGITWTSFSLDYTPTTTALVYEPTSLELNMINDTRGSVILSTPRCEVFFYVTEDGGVTWEKRRNFKLLNYRTDGLHAGGLIDDELGFISFIAREGKNPNVYITRDGGHNWDLMDIVPPKGVSDSGAYADMAYSRDGCVVIPIIYGDAARNYISRDNGATWEWEK